MADDPGIEAEARVVDEGAPVHLSKVDDPDMPFDNGRYRLIEIEWDTGIFGKVVQGSQREDAEESIGTGQHCGNGTYRSVPAPCDDSRASSAKGTTGVQMDIFARRAGMHLSFNAAGAEPLRHHRAQVFAPGASRPGIEYDRY